MNETLNLNGLTVATEQNFLILDDEGDINEMIVEFLQMTGFKGEFYQAYSIHDAKRILSKFKVDYILSDWNLPDGQGVALLKAIRKAKRFEHIPFLMITANSDIESMVTSSKLGVSEYLVKPFNFTQLQDKLVEGWRSHQFKGQDEMQELKEKVFALEEKIEELEAENLELKTKITTLSK